MLTGLNATDLKRWVAENKHLFDPPYKTNRVVAHYREFIVMVLHGPNARLDFHREPGEEFFYQIHGGIELHVKPEGERRKIVSIGEGEIFLCPGGVAHSPRRGEGTWGLVIERARKADEQEEFLWFCETCDELVLKRSMSPENLSVQVKAVYEQFNADAALRTCKACGFVFPQAPVAERLSFLQA